MAVIACARRGCAAAVTAAGIAGASGIISGVRGTVTARVETEATKVFSKIAVEYTAHLAKGKEVLARNPNATLLGKIFLENTRDYLYEKAILHILHRTLGISPEKTLVQTVEGKIIEGVKKADPIPRHLQAIFAEYALSQLDKRFETKAEGSRE